MHLFFDLTHFRELGQKYKIIFVGFLVQMKTFKSAFEINWPLPKHLLTHFCLPIIFRCEAINKANEQNPAVTRISYRVFFPPQSLSIVVDRPDKGSGYDRTIGTVHILRKHIFRLFWPPFPQFSIFYLLKINLLQSRGMKQIEL